VPGTDPVECGSDVEVAADADSDADADAEGDARVVLADLELSRRVTVQLTVVGLLGLVVSFGVFAALYRLGTGEPPSVALAPAGVAWWNDALTLLALVVAATAVVVPHELLHGLAIRRYGGEVGYGVGVAHFVLPYAYATTEHRFGRDQFLVVLLTPLVVMTLVGVPVMVALEWGWLVVPLAANAAGAVADVWMALTLLSYPPHVRVEDHEGGVRVVGRASDRPRELSVTSAVWDALVGAAAASVGLLLALGVGGPVLLGALGVESLAVGRPGTVTYLFAFTNTPEELSLGIGPGVPVLGAGLGLAYAFARAYRRGVRPADGAGEG
jgi:hypothetical protein